MATVQIPPEGLPLLYRRDNPDTVSVVYVTGDPLVVEFLDLIQRIGGQLQPQLLEDIDIHAGEHDRGMDLTAAELGKLVQGDPCVLVCGSAHGKGDQYLICVETGIPAAQVPGLESLDGFDEGRGDQMDFVSDPA